MIKPPAYILAGGFSRRFGSDKARALVRDRPMIRHVADALARATASQTAVADRPGKYDDLGLRTIADAEPGLGPLGGLAAALTDLQGSRDDWLLLVSCDLVAVRPAWVERLVDAMAGHGEASAAAFRGERWEPLCALYHRSLLPEVSARLARRELAMHRLLKAAGAAAVALPTDWPATPQANTPEQLRDYLRSG